MQTIGKKGEDLSAEYLLSQGYQILSRNYRFKKSEIDLICRHQELLVFVEVKSRTSVKFGYPESFISVQQQKAIIRAAEHFLEEKKWLGDIRFDVMAILFANGETQIEHFKDAFTDRV